MIERLQHLDMRRPVHFVGVGGCGMSGVALCLRDMGYRVSGSDMSDGATMERLRQAGVSVYIGHNGGNVPADSQLVVISAAIKPENAEYMAATAHDVPVIKYARMLGILMRDRKGLAVAGTHGKTTTTGMLALALRDLGADPSFVIGGAVPQLDGGSGVGSSEYLVAEACEFDRSFLELHPFAAIINNIEEDHLDYYSGLDEIVEAFRDFAYRVPPEGFIVYGASSTNIARFIDDVPCRTIPCALDRDAAYSAHDIRFESGQSIYRLCVSQEFAGDDPAARAGIEVTLNTFGRHNVINSLSAIAMLHGLGFPLEEAARGVGRFTGARRRFDIIHDGNGVCIVDDYAHHPTAVQTVLRSSRTYFGDRRIVAVFQPHQHSRTRFLMKDFARSFRFADLVIVPDIYFVRDSEKERELVHARDLVRAILAAGGNALYIPSFEEIERFLGYNLHEGDVLLTMGAGNIWEVARHVADRLETGAAV